MVQLPLAVLTLQAATQAIKVNKSCIASSALHLEEPLLSPAGTGLCSSAAALRQPFCSLLLASKAQPFPWHFGVPVLQEAPVTD